MGKLFSRTEVNMLNSPQIAIRINPQKSAVLRRDF